MRFLSMLPILCLCCSFVASATPVRLSAATVATSLDEVDDDFRFQGEYTGCIRLHGKMQRIGLQIRANGDGSFLVAEYHGGLPGAGWNRSLYYSFDAHRNGDTLSVGDKHYRIDVDGQVARFVRWQDGATIGVLTKTMRVSPTLGAAPPPGAIVLFDGKSMDRLRNAKVTPEGLLRMGTQTIDAYRDYTMHLEFRLPYMPQATGQKRGNSGVYLQSRYEIQILDSFGLAGKFNECGALYRLRRPDVNMCLPPLQWQTYDIVFRAPRFDADGNKIRDARLHVCHNGVVIHCHLDVERKTGAGRPEGRNPLPIKLQDHGDPVVYRNIWLVDEHVHTLAARRR